MESGTFLEYLYEPMLREHADRLVKDAELVGAHPFVPVLSEIAPLLAEAHGPPYDDVVFAEVRRLERTVFALEAEEHYTLWDFLADYVRRTPEEFIRRRAQR